MATPNAPLQDPFALVGTTLDGRFAIDRVVARGGFGIVYQGRQLRLRKTIAFKVLFIPGHLDPDSRRIFLDGFAQEAQTIAQLDHPAIVRVFDFGVSASPNGLEMPWMALEWIDGKSLADFLKDRAQRPMSPAEALTVLRPVFQALEFAHAQRVAHRDIKPSNIMLPGGGSGSMAGTMRTRLLDFGIAKAMNPDEAMGSGETSTHALFSAFSLPYAAPEQKAGLRTGPWTDVHALGLILTEMLTGQAPYGNRDRLDVEVRIMSPTRPTPALFHLDVGPWENVIARAVALRPPDRYADAGAFLAALEAALPGVHPVAFNVPGTTEPMQPFAGSTAPPIAPLRRPMASSLSPSTITGSPTTSAAPPPPSRTSRGSLVAALVAVGLLAALGLGAVALKPWTSRENTPAPSASAPPPAGSQPAPGPEPQPTTPAHAPPAPATLSPAASAAHTPAPSIASLDAGTPRTPPRIRSTGRPRPRDFALPR